MIECLERSTDNCRHEKHLLLSERNSTQKIEEIYALYYGDRTEGLPALFGQNNLPTITES